MKKEKKNPLIMDGYGSAVSDVDFNKGIPWLLIADTLAALVAERNALVSRLIEGEDVNAEISAISHKIDAACRTEQQDVFINELLVGSLWVVKGDRFYEKKILKVTRCDLTGITFEDENENLANRLSTKIKDCWGWPSIKHHLGNNTLRRYDNATPDNINTKGNVGSD